MNGIAHILSPASAVWCGWTMFGLLLCAVLAEAAQPGVITQVPTVLFAKTERTYKASPDNVLGQLFITLFRFGVLAMLLLLCFYQGEGFHFLSFLMLMGMVLAVILVKMACNALLDYTFQFTRHYAAPYEQYGAIATLASMLLYPCLLVLLRTDSVLAARWILGVVAAVFFGLILFRWCRTFLRSAASMLYIILYILTMEVVPAAALVWYSSIVSF